MVKKQTHCELLSHNLLVILNKIVVFINENSVKCGKMSVSDA